MASTPDLFSLLPTPDGLGLPDREWVFDTDADAAQLQMPFSDFGSTDLDLPDHHHHQASLQALAAMGDMLNDAAQADLVASAGSHQDPLPAGYQTSNGSSLSVSMPVSRTTSAPSPLFLWSSPSSSPSPRVTAAAATSTVEAATPLPPPPPPSQQQQQKPLPHTHSHSHSHSHSGGGGRPPSVEGDRFCRSQKRGGRSETCLAAALRTLTTLHIAHAACLSAHRDEDLSGAGGRVGGAARQQARTMEAVLATNKDVVAGMGPILACACSASALVQLLLLSICGNLIAWNSAMISAPEDLGAGGDGSGSSNSADDTHPSLPSATGPLSCAQARVVPQPLTIGRHQIGGKLGRALNAQIMAGELRILEGLVDALARRLNEASSSSTSSSSSSLSSSSTSSSFSSSSSKGLASNVHRHIISALHTRLENTRAKIFSLD